MAHDWNQRRLRLSSAIEDVVLPDGQHLWKQTERAAYLALSPREVDILRAFTGEPTIQAVLDALLRQPDRPGIRAFHQLVAEAAARGVLEAADAAAPVCAEPPRTPLLWPVGWSAPVAIAVSVALLVGGTAVLSLNPVRPPLTLWEWAQTVVLLAFTLSASSVLAGCVLHGCGRQVYGLRLDCRRLLPTLTLDTRDAVMGGRRCEVAAAVQALSTPFLVAILGAALGNEPAQFAGLVAAFALGCPFGPTPVHDWLYAVFRRAHQAPRPAPAFLSRRLLVHVLRWRQTAGEDEYLAMYAAATIVWIGLLLNVASRLVDHEAGAIIAGLLSGSAGRYAAAMAAVVMLATVVLGPIAYQALLVAHNLWRVLEPRLFSAEAAARRRRLSGPTPSTAELVGFLRGNLLFGQLSEADCQRVAEAGSCVEVPAGTPLVREGERGDSLFLILSGTACVEREDDMGHVRRLRDLGAGDLFGEVALLERVPRTATVRATAPTRLLRLDHAAFDRLLVSCLGADQVRRTIQVGAALRTCELFAEWPDQALLAVSAEFAVRDLAAGQVVIRAGQPNQTFCVIASGSVEAVRDGQRQKVLRQGEFFGEISLLRDVPATADVRALEPTRCLALERDAFLRLVTRDSFTGYMLEEVSAVRLGGSHSPA